MLRMNEVKRSLFSCAALLFKWQAFGLALVALGRAIVRGERSDARGAWEMAQHLEIAARTAAHELSVELREAYATAPPTSEDEIDALEHLTVISALFLALALFAQHMMRKLAGRSVPGYLCTDFIPSIAQTMIAKGYAPTYLDSS